MHYWVYVHTCPSGKRYVGCTKQARPERRWLKGNGYRYNKHFYSAILKYGWNNIKHEFWELTCESEMYYAEKYLIAYYHTTEREFGYNHSSGGEKSSLGCNYSEEYRKHLSEIQKKVHADPEYREKMSEAVKKSLSDPEVRRKMSEVQKKIHSDPEVRRKMSETAKEGWSDPEVRRKRTEAAKKKWTNPEYRRKRSESLKKVHSDPEYREKISKANKGKSKPRVKIKLPDGTIIEVTKSHIVRNYVNKGKKFEYVS